MSSIKTKPPFLLHEGNHQQALNRMTDGGDVTTCKPTGDSYLDSSEPAEQSLGDRSPGPWPQGVRRQFAGRKPRDMPRKLRSGGGGWRACRAGTGCAQPPGRSFTTTLSGKKRREAQTAQWSGPQFPKCVPGVDFRGKHHRTGHVTAWIELRVSVRGRTARLLLPQLRWHKWTRLQCLGRQCPS